MKTLILLILFMLLSTCAFAQDNTINATLNNAPIKVALMGLFQQVHKNYAIPDGLKGTVTVSLHNVTFNDALNAVLKSAGMDYNYNISDGVYYFTPQPVVPVLAATPVTPEQPTIVPSVNLSSGSYEVIQLKYADASIIASVFGTLPGQMPTIIVPMTSNLSGNSPSVSGRNPFSQTNQSLN